ncbi:hypothetical protein F9B85_11715 [Heliorestis acidaminivorans]|uniref:Methyltransferase domain-containing protein n=1 Tax=Heliorestis acidaminivorans TaxID=553427 RepID=A0A6I0F0S0_9FIRM|nr:class I SAM-dependent methyltransferase [Heliorestis acidaminivorans]KAB2951689.1 hypothetical protein F9B85_11715 [Heliorestis acidaminivorans]
MSSLTSAVLWSQKLLKEKLKRGDFVIDGTAGKGNDSLFLAQHVLPDGLLWAFDIQAEAIEKTKGKLEEAGFSARAYSTLPSLGLSDQLGEQAKKNFALLQEGIHLIRADHSEVDQLLAQPLECPPLKGAIFNLGYLPGGDHGVTTQAETTISALQTLSKHLAPEGRLVVVVYVGHEGSAEEAEAVDKWWTDLPHEQWDTLSISFPNRRGHPPYVLLAEKKKVKGRCK